MFSFQLRASRVGADYIRYYFFINGKAAQCDSDIRVTLHNFSLSCRMLTSVAGSIFFKQLISQDGKGLG